MRRFSALAFRQQKSGSYADSAFSQSSETPMQSLRSNADPSRKPPNNVHLHSPSPSNAASHEKMGTNPETKPMDTTKAMKHLMSAVLRRKYAEAEAIFAAVPRLSERGSALRSSVKAYCEQFDFVSAKALLFQGASNQGSAKTGDAGVARYVAHLTFTARNAQLIDEAFQRSLDYHISENTDLSPKLATTVSNGSLFLGERELFDSNWRELDLETQKAALESHVLRSLLDENWQEAHDSWAELVEDDKILGHLTVWYTASRFFLTETPNLQAIDEILALMNKLGLESNADFTALLLRYMPQLMVNSGSKDAHKSAEQWLQYAQSRGWPLDAQCAEQAIFAAWKQRLPPRKFEEVRRLLSRPANKVAQPSSDRRRSAMGILFNPFRHRIKSAHNDQDVLEASRTMSKQGMTIPYDLMVQAFETALEKSPSHRVSQVIDEMSSLIRQHEYPSHCAGIDLSVVESHSKANRYESRIVRMLLAEYLAQYPLVNNNLSQLTRIGIILSNSGEPEAALKVLDSIRENEMIMQESADPQMPPFSFTNHDCASSQIMSAAKMQLGEELHPTLESLRTSGIYFDQTFVRKVGKLLSHTGEDPKILNELVQENENILNAAKREAEIISRMCT